MNQTLRSPKYTYILTVWWQDYVSAYKYCECRNYKTKDNVVYLHAKIALDLFFFLEPKKKEIRKKQQRERLRKTYGWQSIFKLNRRCKAPAYTFSAYNAWSLAKCIANQRGKKLAKKKKKQRKKKIGLFKMQTVLAHVNVTISLRDRAALRKHRCCVESTMKFIQNKKKTTSENIERKKTEKTTLKVACFTLKYVQCTNIFGFQTVFVQNCRLL